jgi:uncharacterized protein YoxC
MSLTEKMDTLDFLINILEEHEKSLNEINQRLHTLSESQANEKIKPEYM